MAIAFTGLVFLLRLLLLGINPNVLALQDPESPAPLHSLSSPQHFLSNHARMLFSFKVFIYPQIPGYAESDLRSSPPTVPQTAQDAFLRILTASGFVTDDPEAADLFFIPVSIDAMARNKSQSLARGLKGLVQEIRDLYPFWQRTLGADHFLTCCHGFKSEVFRNLLELQKNAIWLACAELFDHGSSRPEDGNVLFFPHKDIAMPPYRPDVYDMPEGLAWHSLHDRPTHREVWDHLEAEAGNSLHLPSSSKRPFLAYLFNGLSPESSAFELLKDDPDFVSTVSASSSLSQVLASSKFCLIFASMGHNNVSIVDGMQVGCVPVIVSDGYLHGLPFQDILNWQSFSVIVSSSQLQKLKAYLMAMPEAKYREMQSAAKKASNQLQWNMPPCQYDAFHMLMHQLWLRRHTIRYTRRSTVLNNSER